MRQSLLALSLFYWSFHFLQAQHLREDTLLSDIAQSKDASQSTAALISLLEEKKPTHLDSLANGILSQLTNGSPAENKIDALLKIGQVYKNKQLAAWGIRFYKEAQSQAEEINNKEYCASALKSLSIIYRDEGLVSDALKSSYDALTIYEELNDHANAANMVYQAMMINYAAGNNDNSINDFELFLKIYPKAKSDSLLIYSLMDGWNLLGLVNRKMENWDESLDAFQKALQIANEVKDRFWISLINGNRGSTLFQMGKLREAIPFLKEDIRTSIIYKEYASATRACVTLAETYIGLNNMAMAKTLLFDSVPPLMRKAKNKTLDFAYTGALAKYYSTSNQFDKAYQALIRQMQLRDSIYNEERIAQLDQIRVRYNIEKKENEIQLLAKNNELQKTQIETQQELIAASVAFAIFVIAFLVYGIISYRRLKNQNAVINKQQDDIEERNAELEAQSHALLKQNEEIERKNTELEAQSFLLMKQTEMIKNSNNHLALKITERTSQLEETIRELDTFLYHASHDIRRPITTLLGLENLARAENKGDMELFNHVARTALEMDAMLFKLQMAHSISHPIHDLSEINLKDLVNTISNRFAGKLNQSHIDFFYEEKYPTLIFSSPLVLEVALFNLIENAIHFRNPDSQINHWIKIACEKNLNNDCAYLFIEDNGIGIEEHFLDRIFELYFRATARTKGNGLGLYLTKKSIEKIQGEISVKSNFGKGTLFKITLPLKYRTQNL